MDPNACFDLILRALANDDTQQVHDSAVDLVTWVSRGGFAPSCPCCSEPLTVGYASYAFRARCATRNCLVLRIPC